jgi:hypothetical protein
MGNILSSAGDRYESTYHADRRRRGDKGLNKRFYADGNTYRPNFLKDIEKLLNIQAQLSKLEKEYSKLEKLLNNRYALDVYPLDKEDIKVVKSFSKVSEKHDDK